MAKFYNIVNKLEPDYDSFRGLTIDYEEFDEKLQNYLHNDKDITTGDIVFIGSHHDRQEYGFILIDKRYDNKYISSEQGCDLIFENEELLNFLISDRKKYKELFESLDPVYSELIGYKNCKTLVRNNYKKHNLW